MAERTRGNTPVRSNMGRATPTTVHVHGQDFIPMLGTVSLGDFAYMELFRHLPDDRESVLFNAIVVALVEHGLTPSALVSRLTIMGAPESLQGAVAAGLLGLGDTFVGTMEGAARTCQTALPLDSNGSRPHLTDEEVATLAKTIYEENTAAGTSIIGLGHPVHKPVDPRAQRLFVVARELGFDDTPIRLMEQLSELASSQRGRALPVNVTGAIGAICTILNIPWNIARGLGVMARAIGLVGHLLEEREMPLAASVWTRAERETLEN
jgi:citrate synthase